MSTTVTGKLNKPATVKMLDSGDAMFIIGLGKKEYDRQSKSEVWANYSAAIYVKKNQLDYHQRTLVANAVVSVSAAGLIPSIWQTQSGESRIDLKMVNPNLEYAITGYDAPANQAGTQKVQQAASSPQPTQEFTNDDIPF